MVEGVQSPLQLKELKLKEKQSRYLTQFLRYRLEPRWTDDDGYVPWTVVKDKMKMSDQDLQSLVAHSVHHVKGCRFETKRGEDDKKFIRAKWSKWDPPQMEASPPSPPSGPPLAAGDLDQFREQLQELTQHLQELTQRCDAAQQENDKLRNQIGDMKKEIDHLKRWNWVHMEEVTAGVRSSSSNDSSNTWVWNGSNSWWTAGSWRDVGSWREDDSNVPWHGK